MGKLHPTDGDNQPVAAVDADGNKLDQTTSPLTPADQSKLLQDIFRLEAELEGLHSDYEYMTEIFVHEPQAVTRSPFHVRAAKWLVNLDKPKAQKVEPTSVSEQEQKRLAKSAHEVQEKIEKLMSERDAKMEKLDATTRSEHEAHSNVVSIRDFVAKRSAYLLPLVDKEAKREADAVPLEGKSEKDYKVCVERLRLTPDQKEKLLSIVHDYDEALATARESDPDIIVPSKEEVIANILKLGTKKLEKIATIMGKPELSFDPANQSFEQMKDDMDLDANRHYENQDKAYFAKDYQWSDARKKVSVSIIDMCQNPTAVPGQEPGKQRNDEQLRACEKYFKEQGMELIHDYQYAMGMQRSLRAYKKAKELGEKNPEKHIIDFYGKPHETVTMFNQEHNTTISKVASGCFFPESRRVDFYWNVPDNQFSNLRGRGAVQVM